MPRSRSSEPPRTAALALLLALSAAAALAKPVLLRETQFIAREVEAGVEVAFTMAPQGSGTAGDQPMQWRAYDADGRLIAEGAPGYGEVTVRYVPACGGVNIVRLTGNRNWYDLVPAEGSAALVAGYGIIASEFAPMHTCGDERAFHFYVPRGTERVRVRVLADSPREGVTVRLLDPDGTVVVEVADQFDRAARVEARAAPGQDGRVWSLRLAPAVGMGFDDVVLWLEEPLPPLVAYDPDTVLRLLRAIPGALPAGE